MVILPVMFGVRPTVVFAPMPTSCSSTRKPANELEKSLNEPIVSSTFQVPSRPAAFAPVPPLVAVVPEFSPSSDLVAALEAHFGRCVVAEHEVPDGSAGNHDGQQSSQGNDPPPFAHH